MTSEPASPTAVRGRRGAWGILLAALLIGGLSLAPRGVEVTVHNMTDRMLDVRVESGEDVAFIPRLEPGHQGAAVVCPKRDTSIQLAFDYGERAVVHGLRVYTFHDAIGSASATIVAGDGDSPPTIRHVFHRSGYSPWSLLPHGLFVRGAGLGLALGLLVAAWISFRFSRRGSPQRSTRIAASVGAE